MTVAWRESEKTRDTADAIGKTLKQISVRVQITAYQRDGKFRVAAHTLHRLAAQTRREKKL